MRIGIAGYGTVGKALERCFRRCPGVSIAVFDKHLDVYASEAHLARLNEADLVFVSVPTPYNGETRTCDIFEVEDIIARLLVPVCIKSTIPPGTTDRLIRSTRKRIAFCPEFLGESADHPWREVYDCGFVIVGGDDEVCKLVHAIYRRASPVSLQFEFTSPTLAELMKYMDNAFLATKVVFVNQFYDLARSIDADPEELRRLWILDARVGDSHTLVSRERGFGGKCLPKDLDSIISWARDRGVQTPLLESVVEYNRSIRTDSPI